MDSKKTVPHDRPPDVRDSAGEAALQLSELILFALIDRGLIDQEDLVAEIESLAGEAACDDRPRMPHTLKARLGNLATSLGAYRSGR